MILGIYREATTAGKPEADIKIADAVAAELGRKGHRVVMTDKPQEESFDSYNAIFSMARSPGTLDLLESAEREGIVVVNSSRAIRACFNRESVYRLMQENGIPVPATEKMLLDRIPRRFPLMLKRADTHGKAGDTAEIKIEDDLARALQTFRERGVEEVLVQDYVGGRHVKFYGVGDKVYLPSYEGERADDMRTFACQTARLVGLDVYGGDIMYDGRTAYVVDINDWPSFSSMREEAARAIAEHILISKFRTN
ncbi:MAG: hypothetical protein HYW25_02875 [Candidatus Aenigmarchaeota archaeon]|nr:hypothetical protein [Candidatus Aenigmarchaeota archaeon]